LGKPFGAYRLVHATNKFRAISPGLPELGFSFGLPSTEVFSPAQLTGYVAFALGVVSFLQRDDRRLKAMIGAQSFSYAVHFYLLGSLPAVAASLVTCTRALVSLRTRSRVVAGLLIAVNLTLGALTAKSTASALPIAASTLGTIAFFWFEGILMRLVLLGATGLWLTNNLLVGSIGGTLLEVFIGASNTLTCYRLWRARGLGSSV
jgi:hypothetical protein